MKIIRKGAHLLFFFYQKAEGLASDSENEVAI